MNPLPPKTPQRDDSSAASLSCAGFALLLAELERTNGGGSSDAALLQLFAHAAVCFPCRARHGARLGVVQGLCALRSRAVPDGLLDDFSDRVLAKARGTRPMDLSAAGMSVAFLDAPQSLARWRWTAVAASLMVALGAGMFFSGRLAFNGAPPAVSDRDGVIEMRDALLDRFDARRADDAPASAVQTVDFPTRGSSDYWGWVPRSDRVILRPVPPAERPIAGK